MGLAAVVTLILGLLRAKAAAVFIGIGGFGFLATFASIQSLFISITGMGMQTCGSRSIAMGLAADDPVSAMRSSMVVTRLSLVSGCVGLSVLVLFSELVSQWSFGDYSHILEIISLGVAVFFSNISNGKIAILQGYSRVTDIARVNSVSALVGTMPLAMAVH